VEKEVKEMTADTLSIENLRQHELVILRRLRDGPLTEFELVQQVAEHSGYDAEAAAENIGAWLEALKEEGLVWAGRLENNNGQTISAAALTRSGRELVA
jgi:DNA-binding PadR family transcriptional regulator